jgi:hypothetical protein
MRPEQRARQGADRRKQKGEEEAGAEQNRHFEPGGPVRAVEEIGEHHLLDGLRVNDDTELTVPHRSRDEIAKADGAGADQDDSA